MKNLLDLKIYICDCYCFCCCDFIFHSLFKNMRMILPSPPQYTSLIFQFQSILKLYAPRV